MARVDRSGVIAVGMAGGGSPAGHRSCAGGAPGGVDGGPAPIAQGPSFGTEFVQPIAPGGAAQETLVLLHAASCEAR